METAREQCADALGATVREIYFTGGGTEADNLAILGMEQTLRAKSKTHVITSAIEHHAVLHPMEELRRRGVPRAFWDDALAELPDSGEAIRAFLEKKAPAGLADPRERKRLADAMGIAPGQVSVKATTEEGLGFTGRKEGIAAHGVCLITKP